MDKTSAASLVCVTVLQPSLKVHRFGLACFITIYAYFPQWSWEALILINAYFRTSHLKSSISVRCMSSVCVLQTGYRLVKKANKSFEY